MPWPAVMTPCNILHRVTLASERSYAPANRAPAAGCRGTLRRAIYYGQWNGWVERRGGSLGRVAATGAVLHRVGVDRFENRTDQGQL